MYKVKFKKEVQQQNDILTPWALEVFTQAGFIESAEKIEKNPEEPKVTKNANKK